MSVHVPGTPSTPTDLPLPAARPKGPRCVVCQQHGEGQLCRACSRSYDRMAAKQGDTWDVVVWAAKRARDAERARHLRSVSRWR